MRNPVPVCAAMLCATVALLAQDAAPPRKSGLVERTSGRLAQLDVTVSGPADAIEGLTREDFEVWIAGEYLDDFLVDRVCREPAPLPGAPPADAPPTDAPPPLPAPAPASFLFYFDQPHLTMAGRNRAGRIAAELVGELIRDGNRATIISTADKLRVYTELSDDPAEVLAAIDTMSGDREQWDPFSVKEEHNVFEIAELTRKGRVEEARRRAVEYQRAERWKTERALRRFEMALGRFAALPPPKAAIYFADTMRANAGAHYVGMFSRAGVDSGSREFAQADIDAFTAGTPYQRVIDQAAALGVRLYTVQAEGLVAGSSRRVSDAQNGLSGFALETGGEAFLNGIPTAKIAQRIEQDLTCLYLISFDPARFAEDAPLSVRVQARPRQVDVQVRGRIVLQSESSRLTSRLLAAFGAPASVAGGGSIGAAIVPTGFEKGRFRALLQVQVPGIPLNGANWDVGATVLSDGGKPLETSGSASVSGPGVPVVLEALVDFKPGDFSVVAVAHEATTDEVVSKEARGAWPNPNHERATVTEIAVLQPQRAVFLRGEEHRTSGALALDADAALRADLPTAFVGMVCWDGLQKKPLRVERVLSGDSAAEFDPLTLRTGDDRCAIFRDLVDGNTMTDGEFVYGVRVLAEDEEVARGSRTFFARREAEGSTP